MTDRPQKEIYTSSVTGITWEAEFREIDDLEPVRHLPFLAVGAWCFYKRKLVLVYAKNKKKWETPGGKIEPGETLEEALFREVKEESNMKILRFTPIGYDVLRNIETNEIVYQLRMFCEVEPFGPFVSDPDDDITEIKLIEPQDYREYFLWGTRSDRMLEKALRLL